MKRLSILVAMLAAVVAVAQEFRGTILGRVTDPGAATVGLAKVSVTNRATGIRSETSTNDAGDYYLPFLIPGSYDLRVEKAGFRAYVRTEIEVRTLDRLRLDVRMELGTFNESVTVTSENPLVTTVTADRGETVSGKMLADIPQNAHNALMLARLMPGVNGGARTFARVFDTGTTIDFGMSGGIRRRNEILLDGVNNTTSDFQVAHIPSADAVAEVRVQTNAYDAEYGHTTGGIVNAVTKSGSNEFHGTGYLFGQHTALDANSFFNNRSGIEKPNRSYYHLGGAAGGPVILPTIYDGHNKAFFFVNVERIKNGDGRSLNFTVPTAAQRAGDFTDTRNQAGGLVVMYDPLTTRANPASAGNFVRDAFAGNRIPASRISPIAKNVLQYYPSPNITGADSTNVNNYGYAGSSPDDYHALIGRIDHALSGSQRVFVRGHWNRRYQRDDDIWGPDNPAGDRYYLGRRGSYGAALDYTHTLTPALLLNLRYGYSRFEDPIKNLSNGFDQVGLGLPKSLVDQMQEVNFPIVSPSGFGSLGYSSATVTALDSHSAQAVVTAIRGKHTMRAGGDYRLYRNNPFPGGNLSGSYSFNAAFTQGPDPLRGSNNGGFSLASMLLGYPSSGSIDRVDALSYAATYGASFVQDDVRVSRRLMLNLGLRADFNGAWRERYDRITRGFAFQTQSPLQIPGIALRGGLIYAGKDGQPRENSRGGNVLGPRFGFAYDAGKGTVIRGGFGMIYSGITYFGSGGAKSTGYNVTTPYVASIDGGLTPANSWSNPFPGSLLRPSGSANGLLTLLGQSVQFYDPSVRIPGNYQFSFSLGKQFAGVWVGEVSYAGSRGFNGPLPSIQWNQLPPSALSQGSALLQTVTNPFRGQIASGPLSGATLTRSRLLRPFPQFDQVTEVSSTRGSSLYHSMQSKLERRFRRGVMVLATYSWSKQLQNYERTGDAPQNHYDLRNEWAVSNTDRTHRATGAWAVELPFGQGKRIGNQLRGPLKHAISNWQVNGTATVESGTPLSFSVTPNNTNALGGGQRPNSTGASARIGGFTSTDAMLTRYFDTAQFTRPEPFSFGNLGRRINDVRGFPFRTLELAAQWQMRFVERYTIQFRAEAFNALNSPDFSDPNTTLGSTAFGTITSLKNTANAARQFQLSLRVRF